MSTGFDELLANEATMHRSLYGGSRPPVQRIDLNFTDAGMGAFGGIAPMIIQPLINALFGHGGMMPAQFSPMQGLYDQWRGKQYWDAHSAAMTTAAQADRETYAQMLRGIAQMKGTQIGLEQGRSINVMAGDLAYMAPFMAQAMPETFDEIHGTRGSATVMASYLHRAGITGVDPVTGRTGISGDSAGVLAAEMHRRFFGVDANLADWRGIRAGQAGALYDELQNRGVMGTSIGAMTREERLAALTGSETSRQDVLRLIRAQDPDRFKGLVAKVAGAADLTGDEQIRKIAGVQDLAASTIRDLEQDKPGQFDALLRQFDANRIGNRLKDMSGAVAAMREIFGDLGKPNAPMSELIEGLNALTQGGLATMNPAELERTVRNTQVIARTSGMGMQALAGLTGQSATMARQMGLDPRFGLDAAQSAAEFGAAFGQVGRGDVAGWGRLDRDKYTLMDDQLRLNAAAAPMSERLGAAMAIYETQKAAGIPMAGTQLEAVAEAIRLRQNSYMFKGTRRSMNLSEADFFDVMAGSNVSEAAASHFLRSPAGIREQIAKYGIADITRRQQPEEIRELFAQGFRESVVGRLEEVGITGDQATDLATVASQVQAAAMIKMPANVWNVRKTRTAALAAATRSAVIKRLRETEGLTEDQAAARFEQIFPAADMGLMVEGGIARIEQLRAMDPNWANYPSANAMRDLSNPEVFARGEVLRQERAAEVALGSALAGLGTAGPIARVMNQVMNPASTFGQAIKEVLGSIDTGEVRKRLSRIDLGDIEKRSGIIAKERTAVIMEEMMRTVQNYEKDRKVANLSPEQQDRLRQRFESRMGAMRGTGEGSVDDELKAELFNAGIINSMDADSATVRAAAQRVLRGEVKAKDKPDEFRDTVQALTLLGAGIDAKALRREQETVLARMGITKPEEIESALRGELDKDERMKGEDRETFMNLRRVVSTFDTVAADAGYNVGATVGADQLANVTNQQELLDIALAKKLPTAAGPELDEAIAERELRAGNVTEQGRRLIDLLLANTASMKNVGMGGFKVVKDVREHQKEMERLARVHGLDLAKVVGGTADIDKMTEKKKAAALEIISRSKQIGAGIKDITARMQQTKDRKPMTQKELDDLTALQAEAQQPDQDKNEKLVRDIAGTMGVEAKTDTAMQAAVAKEIGEGPEAESRRYALSQSLTARNELLKMAEERKLSLIQLKKEAAISPAARFFGMSKITSQQAAEANKLFETAGELGLGDTLGNIQGAVKQIKKREAEASGDISSKALPDKITMAGRVTIEGNQLAFTGTTGTPGNIGSTPVATG